MTWIFNKILDIIIIFVYNYYLFFIYNILTVTDINLIIFNSSTLIFIVN